MNADKDQAPPVPTQQDAIEAAKVLADGILAVEIGAWTPDMQEARDQARGVLNRARAAGVI